METPKAVLAETGPGGKPSIRRNFEEETRTLPNDFRKIQGGTPRNLINKYKGLITVNKLIVAFLAAFLVSGAMADGHDFPDVPANHWAGDAVHRIADHGIIIGFPDGTFRGNESFTRYQAALVISRTVAVLSANAEAANAMTADDIASLRNALQSLASDVSANSVRLAAHEAAIASIADAGEVRSDDIAALSLGNAARLDDLEAAIHDAHHDDGASSADVQELQDHVASLGQQRDLALSAAASAGDLASDALAHAGKAAARARENAAAVSALGTVVNLLSDNVVALVQAPAPAAVDVSGIASNASDIGNIREFVITLRRDQVAIGERVSALEASDAANSAAITSLEGRVTTLESNVFDVSGTLGFDFDVVRTGGAGEMFDIDRAFGDGFTAGGVSAFSTGTFDDDDDGEIDREANEDAEVQGNVAGDFATDLSVSMGWASAFDGVGSPNGLNSFDGVLDISIEALVDDAGVAIVDEDGNAGYGIIVESGTVAGLIGDESSLFFNFGEESGLQLGGYGADHVENDGFNFGLRSDSIAGDAVLNGYYVTTAANAYATGLEGRLAPLDGFSGGAMVSINNTNASEAGDSADDNVRTLVWGFDGAATLSLVDVTFEYQNGAVEGGDSLSAVTLNATVDTTDLGVLNELSLGYFDVPAGWIAHASADADIVEDNAGFIINTGVDLLTLDIDGHFTQYNTATEQNRAFGASVALDLDFGLTVSGSFNQAYQDGTLVDAATERDAEYESNFGVTVDHDGSADDAIIDGLTLGLAYTQSEADNSGTEVAVSAEYGLSFGVLAIDPYANYTRTADSDADADDTTELLVGASVSSETLDVLMAPSLSGNVNYRTNAHSMADADGDEYTATEIQFSAGVTLNEFLFDNSVLSATYASYSGTNTTVDAGADATITAVSTDADTSGVNSTTSGFELSWTYWDLNFLYGQFTFDPDTATASDASSAQYFSLSYTIDF